MVSFKTLKASALAGVAALTVSAAAHAQSTFIFNDGVFGAPSGYTLYDDFNTTAGQSAPFVTGSGYNFFTGDVPGRSVAIPGNTTPYLSVAGGGTATLDFTPFDVRSFAFDYSTVDTYNTLTINYAGGGSQSYTGTDILAGLPSGRTSGSIIVNGNGALISSLTLTTTGNAFEVDNLSYSNTLALVPEAATWMMMVSGFGLMGAAMRRKKVSVAFSA